MSENVSTNWHLVAKTSEVVEDEPKAVRVGDHLIALFSLDGDYFATHDICTHEFASLSEGFVDGDLIECPLHAGTFNIRTGKAMSPPVTEDIRTYSVKVEGDDIYVAVETD